MAAVHGHAVVERRLALHLLLVTGIRQPSVGLEENGWAKVLLRVPPVGWAGCGATGAKNALVETIELLALLNRLEIFLSLLIVSFCYVAYSCFATYVLSRGVALEIWLDGLVLLVELGQIWDDVLDDVGVWQWVDLGLVLGINWNTACFFVSSCPECPSTRLYARYGWYGNKAVWPEYTYTSKQEC